MDSLELELRRKANEGMTAGNWERRKFPRFSWQGTAVMRILPSGPEVLGALLDVSECGCGVEFGVAIPAQVGSRVEVDVNVRGMTLKRRGVIRRIEVIRRTEMETRAGIEFVVTSERRVDRVEFQ